MAYISDYAFARCCLGKNSIILTSSGLEDVMYADDRELRRSLARIGDLYIHIKTQTELLYFLNGYDEKKSECIACGDNNYRVAMDGNFSLTKFKRKDELLSNSFNKLWFADQTEVQERIEKDDRNGQYVDVRHYKTLKCYRHVLVITLIWQMTGRHQSDLD